MVGGVDTMARPKAKGKAQPPAKGQAEAAPGARVTIISLKGTPAQADWLDDAHRKTHISKSVLVRLALDLLAKDRGLPPFPVSGGDDE
jgi:hypothetical protein